MNDVKCKKEIKPIASRVLLRAMEINPYMSVTTEAGLILTQGQFDNPDSGERDMKDFPVQCAEVIEVGPECRWIKPGDHVMVTLGSLTPIPFKGEILWSTSEINVLTVMADDLEKRF